ncbi:DUF6916 family protein [Nocardioides sp. GXZ039]|uniref:DUF6916 family protein n=1 Tax=Nocardioides sp. GXZ039 TaxID=3136018 RepID=UPI0030F404BA
MRIDHAFLTAAAGSDVEVLTDDGVAALTLRLGQPSEAKVAGGWVSYSVDLTGPADAALEQGSYRLRFPNGHEDWLMVVPSASDGTRTVYHAAFNQEQS